MPRSFQETTMKSPGVAGRSGGRAAAVTVKNEINTIAPRAINNVRTIQKTRWSDDMLSSFMKCRE
jgi:hypothetical protein